MAERNALVTGAARGIGRAIALELAATGCAVAVGDVGVEGAQEVTAEVERAGGRAPAVEPSTDTGSVDDAVARVASELGPVDMAVNNAGWDELRPFLETDESFWQRVIEVNFMGGLRVTRAVLRGMVDRGWAGQTLSVSGGLTMG